MAALLSGGCGSDPASDPAPYGLSERVDNETCVVETDDGTGMISVAPTLSATGCYADLESATFAPGVIPFDINVTSFGVPRRRYFTLPAGTTIGFNSSGAWDFPVGSILVKEFLLDRVSGDESSRFLVETRFFLRGEEDAWRGYSYRWNDDGTEGELLADSASGDYEIMTDGVASTYHYTFPSRTACLRCHPVNAGAALGPRTEQMNRGYDYAGVLDNQLRALNHAGYFDRDISADLGDLPALPDPDDTSLPLETRARAILHADCMHCHQPQGSAASALIQDLRFDTALVDTAICDEVVPGNAAQSNLWQQIEGLTMPPNASKLDPRLVVVRDWIDSLETCP